MTRIIKIEREIIISRTISQNHEEKEFYDNIEFQDASAKEEMCRVIRQKDGDETNSVVLFEEEILKESGMMMKIRKVM